MRRVNAKVSQEHEQAMRRLRDDLDFARAECKDLRDELNAARTHAALVESDLEGMKQRYSCSWISLDDHHHMTKACRNDRKTPYARNGKPFLRTAKPRTAHTSRC